MTPRRALKRIDRHIAELMEIRRQNFLKVSAGVDFDKMQLRRGNYDADPLIELLDRRSRFLDGGIAELCEVRELPERAIFRLKETRWVTPRMADLICCRLGVPTVCVYPYEQMSLEAV